MRKRPLLEEYIHTSKGNDVRIKRTPNECGESSVQTVKGPMARIEYPQIVLFGDSIASIAFRKGVYGSDLTSRVSCQRKSSNKSMNSSVDSWMWSIGGCRDSEITSSAASADNSNSTQLLCTLERDQLSLHRDGSLVKLWILHLGTNDWCVA